MKLIPRHDFDALATAHHNSQCVTLATGHLAKRHSLRDIQSEGAGGAALSSRCPAGIADIPGARVNEEQPWKLYEALFAKSSVSRLNFGPSLLAGLSERHQVEGLPLAGLRGGLAALGA